MEEDRHVILRNGEFHLARREGGKWLATDRAWPSVSAAKRAAEDIGQSISFRGGEVEEKDLHFFLNNGGHGHIWFGRSTLCGNTADANRSRAVTARPLYLCAACVAGLRPYPTLFDRIFPPDEVAQTALKRLNKTAVTESLNPTEEELHEEGILLFWSEKLGQGILTKRVFWPGFVKLLAGQFVLGVVPKIGAAGADQFFRDVKAAGEDPASVRVVLMSAYPKGMLPGPLYPSTWALLLNRCGLPVSAAAAYWLAVTGDETGFGRPPKALDRDTVLRQARSFREWDLYFREHETNWREGLPEGIPSFEGRTARPSAASEGAVLLAHGDVVRVEPVNNGYRLILVHEARTFVNNHLFADFSKTYPIVCAVIEKGEVNLAHWTELRRRSR